MRSEEWMTYFTEFSKANTARIQYTQVEEADGISEMAEGINISDGVVELAVSKNEMKKIQVRMVSIV